MLFTTPSLLSLKHWSASDVTETENGEWGMGNGEWEWGMGMGNRESGIGNEEWGMGNGEWEIVVSGNI